MGSGSAIEKWATEELARLGLCDLQVIVQYLDVIEDPEEMREYLNSMLDTSQPSHATFIEEFIRRQREAKGGTDVRFYRKPNIEEESFKVTDRKQQRTPNGRGHREGGSGNASTPPTTPNTPNTNTHTRTTPSSSGKREKFVNLYSKDAENMDVVLLSGRQRCECQASKHKLVGNCLKCGRVVCHQEGSGPCHFCGNLVVTREERELLNRGSKKSEALQRRLMSEKNAVVREPEEGEGTDDVGLQKAVEHKNRLLEYDRTSERRTKVLDDQRDYFGTDSKWLSEDQRKKLRQREEELRAKRFSRGGRTVTLDLAGRRVFEDKLDATIYNPDDPLVREVLESNTEMYTDDKREGETLIKAGRPMYVDSGVVNAKTNTNIGKVGGLIVQDRELQEMRDEGMCLSMHQPWASLLVLGIKKHEGRTWYSAHRGRLWIAAASKTPDQETVRQVEDQYRLMTGDDALPFPNYYPASCLLGCVDVVDVLPQEEYRERYPEGESDSPYVFVCENPQEMILKFPIKGQHKIFKLDTKIHITARKAIRPRQQEE